MFYDYNTISKKKIPKGLEIYNPLGIIKFNMGNSLALI